MIHAGRIPLTAEEHAAVEKLLAHHKFDRASLTRRDPGETGPVLVHLGDTTWVVDEAGNATKQKARRR